MPPLQHGTCVSYCCSCACGQLAPHHRHLARYQTQAPAGRVCASHCRRAASPVNVGRSPGSRCRHSRTTCKQPVVTCCFSKEALAMHGRLGGGPAHAKFASVHKMKNMMAQAHLSHPPDIAGHAPSTQSSTCPSLHYPSTHTPHLSQGFRHPHRDRRPAPRPHKLRHGVLRVSMRGGLSACGCGPSGWVAPRQPGSHHLQQRHTKRIHICMHPYVWRACCEAWWLIQTLDGSLGQLTMCR